MTMRLYVFFRKRKDLSSFKSLVFIGLFLSITVNLFGQATDIKPLEKITDNRDGKSYPIVKVGNQTWMAENLAFKPLSGSCCYDNDDFKCQLFGRLYTWSSAKEACPEGWHLPSDKEWKTLFSFVGENPCLKLKSKAGFWPEGHYGTDNYDFSATGAGYRSGDKFWDFAKNAIFWSSNPITETGWGSAIAASCNSGEAGIKVLRGDHEARSYNSIRCIKDN
jgi:uncharacterized protein (TIGR02145 family)